jgi:hypothetical protein
MSDFIFSPLRPSEPDMRAYVMGYFPTTLLGNHIQWAINYLNLGEVLKHNDDCFPRFKMYIVEACKKYLEDVHGGSGE